VRHSYEYPLETLTTNAIGTANILDALRSLKKPVVAIMITSDKAYDNLEWVWGYRETDRLGGKDPYSASKGMAELVISAYVESFFNSEHSNVRVGITRAGNVIGGGDWAVDRIVPDCIQAWSLSKTVDIRSPQATRPWQHVLEPLSGYLALGAALAKNNQFHGEAYNFGPPSNQNYPVSELIDEMAKYWDHVRWNDISQSKGHLHEASLLKLNCDKALFDLHWQPTLHFSDMVKMTVEWYKCYYQNRRQSMYDFTVSQINEYTGLAKVKDISWNH
jgi:CDP-glucose 4,6-dehydratase